LMVIDEAARVPDDLYRAVSPMLSVSCGRMVCLSTPYGKRGFFYNAWAKGGDDWHRIEVPAERITRIKLEVLQRERRQMGSRGIGRSTAARSRLWRAWSTPILPAAWCRVPRLPVGAWAVSI